MEKRMLWLGVAVVVVGLCSSGALAVAMGPPTAGLDAGQFRAGLDITSSEIGIDLDSSYIYWGNVKQYVGGTKVLDEDLLGGYGAYEFKDDLQSEMLLANIGYGINDQLEVYLLVGLSDLGFGTEEDYWSMDDDFPSTDEIAYGFGVKGTIMEEENLKFGALFQMIWASFDGDTMRALNIDDWDKGLWAYCENVPGSWDLDYYQIKIAVGPTYKLNETISIYGGPFYQILDGTLDEESSAICKETVGATKYVDTVASKRSTDISARSRYGVYVGAQINCGGNLPLCVECQTSNDIYVVGASLAYKF